MLHKKKIIVVMPAYNAEKTLETTYREIPLDIVDEVIVVDDASRDNTFEEAKRIGIKHIIRHEKNKGYGGNQKTCYDKALAIGADIVIMLHCITKRILRNCWQAESWILFLRTRQNCMPRVGKICLLR